MADGSLEYLLSLEVEGAREAAAEVQAAVAQSEQALYGMSRGAEDSRSALESLRADLGLDDLNDRIDSASEGLQRMGDSAEGAGVGFQDLVDGSSRIAALTGAVAAIQAAVEAYNQAVQAAAATLRGSSQEAADLLRGTQRAFREIATEDQRARFVENTREDIRRLNEEIADLQNSLNIEDIGLLSQAEFALLGSSAELDLKVQQVQSLLQLVSQLNGLVDEAQGKDLFDAAAFEEQAQRFQDATDKLQFFELGDDLEAKLEVTRARLEEAQQQVRDALSAQESGPDTDRLADAADAQNRVLDLKRQEKQLVDEITRQQETAAREAERAAEAVARQEARDKGRRLRDAERTIERQTNQRDAAVDSLVRVGLNIGSVRDPGADDMRRLNEEQVAKLENIREAITNLDTTTRFS